MYYVYIIESLVDSSFYIGYSKKVQQRLLKHNNAKSGYTSRKQPWILRYVEQFDNKTDAIKREIFLKRQKNRNFYLKLIENQKDENID